MKILTITLLALSCVILLETVGEAVREDELVLYLSFDEAKGDTAKDKSKHKNDGTLHKAKRVKGKMAMASNSAGTQAVGWKCQIPTLWILPMKSP